MRCRQPLFWAATALFLHRLSRRSGVTRSEFTGPMPGDDLIHKPSVEWTRATNIDAPPERVWPWLKQMGFGRGGWYTSRLFDRVVWRIDNPSSEVLLPEFQHIEVGQVIPDGPDYAAYFRVADVEPSRWIVYRSIRHPYRSNPIDPSDPEQIDELEHRLFTNGVYLDFSWAWEIRPLPEGRSRLLVRTRANYSPGWLLLSEIPLGLVDFYHVSTMFTGIRRRLRSHHTPDSTTAPSDPT